MGQKSSAVYPNIADLYRGKTPQSTSNVAAHSLGQVEAYLTVHEIMAEASPVAPPKAGLWREHCSFCRWTSATLGLSTTLYWHCLPLGHQHTIISYSSSISGGSTFYN
jgi:hypothetical protein